MYCLVCHAKIPRLRRWRTASEFCSDEHAEQYKKETVGRLLEYTEPARPPAFADDPIHRLSVIAGEKHVSAAPGAQLAPFVLLLPRQQAAVREPIPPGGAAAPSIRVSAGAGLEPIEIWRPSPVRVVSPEGPWTRWFQAAPKLSTPQPVSAPAAIPVLRGSTPQTRSGSGLAVRRPRCMPAAVTPPAPVRPSPANPFTRPAAAAAHTRAPRPRAPRPPIPFARAGGLRGLSHFRASPGFLVVPVSAAEGGDFSGRALVGSAPPLFAASQAAGLAPALSRTLHFLDLAASLAVTTDGRSGEPGAGGAASNVILKRRPERSQDIAAAGAEPASPTGELAVLPELREPLPERQEGSGPARSAFPPVAWTCPPAPFPPRRCGLPVSFPAPTPAGDLAPSASAGRVEPYPAVTGVRLLAGLSCLWRARQPLPARPVADPGAGSQATRIVLLPADTGPARLSGPDLAKAPAPQGLSQIPLLKPQAPAFRPATYGWPVVTTPAAATWPVSPLQTCEVPGPAWAPLTLSRETPGFLPLRSVLTPPPAEPEELPEPALDPQVPAETARAERDADMTGTREAGSETGTRFPADRLLDAFLVEPRRREPPLPQRGSAKTTSRLAGDAAFHLGKSVTAPAANPLAPEPLAPSSRRPQPLGSSGLRPEFVAVYGRRSAPPLAPAEPVPRIDVPPHPAAVLPPPSQGGWVQETIEASRKSRSSRWTVVGRVCAGLWHEFVRPAVTSKSGKLAAAGGVLLLGVFLGLRGPQAPLRDAVRAATRPLAERAFFLLEEPFAGRLDAWTRPEVLVPGGDGSAELHEGVTLFRPSLALTDYEFSFTGLIRRGGLGWVVRASPAGDEGYAFRLAWRGRGRERRGVLFRYALREGLAAADKFVSLPFELQENRPYEVVTMAHGGRITTVVAGFGVDSFTDPRHGAGGAGFVAEAGDAAQVHSVSVSGNDDGLGRTYAWVLGFGQYLGEKVFGYRND